MLNWRQDLKACLKTATAITEDGFSMPALDALPLKSRAIYLSFAGLLLGRALEIITLEYEQVAAELEMEKRIADKLARRAKRKAEKDAAASEGAEADDLVSEDA